MTAPPPLPAIPPPRRRPRENFAVNVNRPTSSPPYYDQSFAHAPLDQVAHLIQVLLLRNERRGHGEPGGIHAQNEPVLKSRDFQRSAQFGERLHVRQILDELHAQQNAL